MEVLEGAAARLAAVPGACVESRFDVAGRRHWLARAETHVALTVMGAGLLAWPLVAVTERMPFVYAGLAYLFAIWAVLLLALVLVARALREAGQAEKTVPRAPAPSSQAGVEKDG